MEENTGKQLGIGEIEQAVEGVVEKVEGSVEDAVEKVEGAFGHNTDEPEAASGAVSEGAPVEPSPEPASSTEDAVAETPAAAEEAAPAEEVAAAEPVEVAESTPEPVQETPAEEHAGAEGWNPNTDGAGQYDPKPGEAKTPPGTA